ncbi:MAG: M48 family metallopeptidase [Kofleriaceae bacterium]
MRGGTSLTFRVVLALVLMAAFYALAVTSAVGLVWLGLKLFSWLEYVRGRGIIAVGAAGVVCLVAAGIVVWSVLPRWDRFEPPGPEITEAQHLELFAEIRRVSEATGEQMPAHVYLVLEVNAFVAQRGGIMGIGSRRVMGIGVPLLRTLQVDEMRAVIAHEMGHFYGGDTKLGPWIYKTRGALVRTVFNLARARARTEDWIHVMFAVLQAPFRWFGIGYMRVTQAISRAQEYSADAVAVRVEGRRAVVEGFKKTHAAALAHELYLRNEVAPLVSRGALPAVGEGFSRYLANERMTKLLDQVVAAEMTEGTGDPYDSHPPLRERIEAAQRIDGPERAPEPRRAIELLRDPEAFETEEIARRVETTLERIAWSDTAPLWIASWRKEVAEAKGVLAGLRPGDVPIDDRAIYDLAIRQHGNEQVSGATEDDLRGWWFHLVGAALSVVLVDDGFEVTTGPGEPFQFTRGEVVLEPFLELNKLGQKELSRDDWRAIWEKLYLGDVDLGAAAAAASAA